MRSAVRALTPSGEVSRARWVEAALLISLLAVLGLTHAAVYEAGEPFFDNDESRHVMTSVFFRDLVVDLPIRSLRDYTVSYYVQYPGLVLIVTPPLFHLITGLVMAVFGASMLVAKVLIVGCAALACTYLFLLVRWTHDRATAALAAALFAFSPLVFFFSRHVMMEIPTLAFGLAATYHFVRYLDRPRWRDVVVAALAAAAAGLTRFSGVYLVPLFLILIALRRPAGVWRRGEVWAAAALGVGLVLPFYALAAAEVGWLGVRLAAENPYPNAIPILSAWRLLFYPSLVPQHIGWFALVPALMGLAAGLTAARRRRSWPYFGILVATYITFIPVVNMEPRYVIYWIPAFALFAADGVMLAAGWLRGGGWRPGLAVVAALGTAWTALGAPRPFVRGYTEAARYVAANSGDSRFCLFDGDLSGNFVYQIRRLDPDRRLWVLRGDKLFFNRLVYGLSYTESATSDEDVLSTVFRYDPALIVVEEPRTFTQARRGQRFRQVVRRHPERFRLEAEIPIDSNERGFRGVKLQVYRNLVRNPDAERRIEVNIPMVRRSFEAVSPAQAEDRVRP